MARTNAFGVSPPLDMQARVYDADDALTRLPDNEMFALIKRHVEGRPNISPEGLEAFSDQLRRLAWKLDRQAAPPQ